MIPAPVTRKKLINRKDRVIKTEMQRGTEFMKVIKVRHGALVMLVSLRDLHLKFQTLCPNKKQFLQTPLFKLHYLKMARPVCTM